MPLPPRGACGVPRRAAQWCGAAAAAGHPGGGGHRHRGGGRNPGNDRGGRRIWRDVKGASEYRRAAPSANVVLSSIHRAPAAPSTSNKGAVWVGAETTPPLQARTAAAGHPMHQSGGRRQRPPEAARSRAARGEPPTERDAVLVLQGAPPTAGLAGAGVGPNG